MLLVADASVIVPALADVGPVGDAVRTRLTELAHGELHIVQNFTDLEVISALRTLARRDKSQRSPLHRPSDNFHNFRQFATS